MVSPALCSSIGGFILPANTSNRANRGAQRQLCKQAEHSAAHSRNHMWRLYPGRVRRGKASFARERNPRENAREVQRKHYRELQRGKAGNQVMVRGEGLMETSRTPDLSDRGESAKRQIRLFSTKERSAFSAARGKSLCSNNSDSIVLESATVIEFARRDASDPWEPIIEIDRGEVSA